MAAAGTRERIHADNVRYHDLAAAHYDAKWGIDYGPVGQAQVLGKVRKALGRSEVGRFPEALEIGAGTGYFGINLARAGAIDRYTATDISPGMVDALRSSAEQHGVSVHAVCAPAEQLPLEDASFDLVFGHAILHHLPDLDACLGEMTRVLRPGGALVFCGEPSRHGDRLAALPKRAALRAAPLWRALLRVPRAPSADQRETVEEDELERVVDVHAFTPTTLAAAARAAGLGDVTVRGEELTASLFGWANRSLEATADPAGIPRGWFKFAYHGYLALQRVDRALLEPHLPPALFYNLLLSARRPTG